MRIEGAQWCECELVVAESRVNVMKIFNFKMATTAEVEKVKMQFSWSYFDAERISGRISRVVVRGSGVFPNASTMNFGEKKS